jgi:hypothetical protein
MRGHARCRAHRVDELGPGGAGAPLGNLNALQTGRHAHPLHGDELSAASCALLDPAGDLSTHVADLTRSIASRTEDPFLVLVALRAAVSQLVEATAARIFECELAEALAPLPEPLRDRHHARICALVAALRPEQRLFMLRRTLHRRKKRSR